MHFTQRTPFRTWVCLLLLAFIPRLAQAEPKSSPLRVVSTVFPAYAAAKAIAGSAAEVDNLLPNYASAHGYQLSPGDLRKLSSADLIVMNGLGLDDWIQKALKTTKARVIRLSDGLEARLLKGGHHEEQDHHHDQAFNPHFWLDPKLMILASSNILQAMVQLDPAQQSVYQANEESWKLTLESIDREFSTALIAVRKAPFVTMHDAFGYLAKAYDLKVVGVVETVADVSPGPQTLSRLLESMRQEKVTVIFGEKGGANRMAERIARDLNIRTAQLDPLESGQLTPTAYAEGMKRNLDVLVRELGGEKK